MWQRNEHDLSGTAYLQRLEEKTEEYTVLINKAQEALAENGNKPCRLAAQLYTEAVGLCEQVMSMNVAQTHVKQRWKEMKDFCQGEANKILAALRPPEPKKEEPKKETRPVRQPAPEADNAKDDENLDERQKRIREIAKKHATKEVTLDMIEKWFKDCPEHGFDAIIGREKLKKRLMDQVASLGWDKLDEALAISPVQCYFLYGPPGSGKTFLIEAFANEVKKLGFEFMQLKGSEVHASYVGVAEKVVTAAFEVALEQDACLIFMDEIDNLCVERNGPKAEGHEKRLTASFLEAYNSFKKSKKRMIFIGATNHPAKVDSAMLDRISLIKIPLPDQVERVAYFDRIIRDPETKEVKIAIEEGFAPEEMAEATDNYSYRDLDRVRDYMLGEMKVQAMTEYAVLDAEGKLDKPASDEAASRAIKEGKLKLTRQLFQQALKDNLPSDKTEIRMELAEFEARVASGNME